MVTIGRVVLKEKSFEIVGRRMTKDDGACLSYKFGSGELNLCGGHLISQRFLCHSPCDIIKPHTCVNRVSDGNVVKLISSLSIYYLFMGFEFKINLPCLQFRRYNGLII